MAGELGYLYFDLELDTKSIEKAIDSAADKVSNSMTKEFEKSGKKIEDVFKNAEKATDSVKRSTDSVSKSMAGAASAADTMGEKINAILQDSDRSMKSKAASIAGIYRNQGMDASKAMTTAWEQIERGCADSTEKSKKHLFDFGNSVKKTANDVTYSAKKTADDITNSFSGVNQTLKKMVGTLASVFAVKEIINFGKECLELGSDLAEVENVVDVTFPHMTAAVDEWAKSAANSFGLSETMAKQYTGTFGSMAEAFGFTEKQAYEMSTTLTGLAGDVASFYNLSQDEAYTKLKSVFTGETESLKELGVVMTQGALDQYALANGFGKTTQKMTEAEKVSLRYAFVQEQLANATGDFARTSDSWANQVRILSLQFDSLKATIGQGLINLFTPIIKVINSVISRVSTLANAFKSFTELITGKTSGSVTAASNISSIGDAGSSAASGITDAADATQDLEKATSAAGDAAEKAAKQALGLMGFDAINKLSENSSSSSGSDSGSSSSDLAGDSIDYGSLAESTEETNALGKAMADAIQVFKDAWDTKGQLVMDSWRGALESVKGLGLDVGQTFLDVWNDDNGYRYCTNILDIVADLGQAVDVLAESFQKAWDDNNTGYNYLESIFNKWNGILELIHEVSQSVITVWGNGTGSDILENWLQTCTNINNAVGNLASRFKDAWTEASTGADIIQNLADNVNIFSSHVNSISKGFENWTSKLDFGPLLESFEDLTGALELITDDAGEGLEWLFDSVLQPIGKWTLEEGAPAALETISSFLKLCDDVLDTVGPQLEDLYDSFFEPMASFAADRAVDFLETLQDFMDSLDEEDVLTIESVGLSILGFKVVQNASTLAGLVWAAIKDKLETLVLTLWEIKDFLVTVDWATVGFSFTGTPNAVALVDPIISNIDEYLSENLPDALADAIGGAIAGFTAGGVIGGAIGVLGGPIGMLGGAVAGSIVGAIANEFVEGSVTFDDVVDALFTGLGGAFTGTAAGAVIGTVLGGPAGTLAGAVVGAIAGSIAGAIAENWDTLLELGKNLIDGLYQGIDAVLTGFATWVDEHIATPFVNAFKALFGIHSPSTVMAEIGGFLIKGLLEGIKDAVSGIGTWIKTNVVDKVLDAMNGVKEVAVNIKGKVDGTFRKAKEEFLKIKNSDAVKTLKKAFGSGYETAMKAYKAITSGSATKTLKKAFGSGYESAMKAFKAITSGTATKTLKAAGQSAIDKAKKSWDSLKSKAINLSLKLNGQVSNVKSTVNGIIDSINKNVIAKIKLTIPKNWPIGGGMSIGPPPNIPRLAQGGFVKANTPQLAVIGDNTRYGEIIAPENKLEAMAKKAAEQAQNGDMQQVIVLLQQIVQILLTLNLDIYMDGVKVTKRVIEITNQLTKTTGKTQIIV